MHHPHRSPDHPTVEDVGWSLAASPRASAHTSDDASLPNELARDTSRPNVLVIGPVAQVEDTVSTIVATLLTPVCYWTPDAPLAALGAESTVVIRDVATWCLDLQQAWLTWLNEPGRRPRIIATSSIEIFPLVAQGLFLEALYYRLNTVLVDLWKSDRAA